MRLWALKNGWTHACAPSCSEKLVVGKGDGALRQRAHRTGQRVEDVSRLNIWAHSKFHLSSRPSQLLTRLWRIDRENIYGTNRKVTFPEKSIAQRHWQNTLTGPPRSISMRKQKFSRSLGPRSSHHVQEDRDFGPCHLCCINLPK